MIKTYDYYIKNVGEVGYVRSVFHSMVYASGLPKARVMELVVTDTGQRGIIQSLLADSVEILMLDGRPVRHGTLIARTNEILTIPVGQQLLGRSVDPFVNPIDGKSPFSGFTDTREFENMAPPIYRRQIIDQPFVTGVSVVDLMVPLGKGQRELVVGDQKTGKSAFLLQTMLSQSMQGAICIYVAIGKKKTDIKRIEEFFAQTEYTKNNIIVAADASSPASFIYLVPFTGMSIAEYFRDLGQDVLLIFDDLNTHAKLYREIALLSKKTPGREAYPGDIFYLHSHLLERAGKIKLADGKSASITLLASVETVGGDFTGYIPTNAMSMTDGHIYFDAEVFKQGVRPAVNVSLSVSRVGRQTQTNLERELYGIVSSVYADYFHAQNYSRFGVELSQKTREMLKRGEKMIEIFQQDSITTVPKFLQVLCFGLLFEDYWNDKAKLEIIQAKSMMLQAYGNGELDNFKATADKVENFTDYRAAVRTHLTEINQALTTTV